MDEPAVPEDLGKGCQARSDRRVLKDWTRRFLTYRRKQSEQRAADALPQHSEPVIKDSLLAKIGDLSPTGGKNGFMVAAKRVAIASIMHNRCCPTFAVRKVVLG